MCRIEEMRLGKEREERSGGGEGERGVAREAAVCGFVGLRGSVGCVGRSWGDGAAVGRGEDGIFDAAAVAIGREDVAAPVAGAAALVGTGPDTDRFWCEGREPREVLALSSAAGFGLAMVCRMVSWGLLFTRDGAIGRAVAGFGVELPDDDCLSSPTISLSD